MVRTRLASPLFLEFVIAQNLIIINESEKESSDRRLRNTDLLFVHANKARSVKKHGYAEHDVIGR